MIVTRHRNFLKHFRSRVLHNKSLRLKFEERLVLFIENSHDPILKDHQLTGKLKEFRAFSVEGDMRVIYKDYGDQIVLYDIGSHNQIY